MIYDQLSYCNQRSDKNLWAHPKEWQIVRGLAAFFLRNHSSFLDHAEKSYLVQFSLSEGIFSVTATLSLKVEELFGNFTIWQLNKLVR